MTGKRITDLLDNAVIAAAEVGEWLLRRVPARDPQVRRAELSREALREVLVAAEEQRENWEPNEFWCNEHDTFCVHPQSGIPASGADASPPEMSGDSPSHQPSGGLSTSELLHQGAVYADLLAAFIGGKAEAAYREDAAKLRDRAALFESYEAQ